MGTRLGATVLAPDRDAAISAIEDAFREVHRLDAVLSSWRPDAELARLNRASPGVPVRVSTELYGWLREAATWVEPTGGAFDPAVGALIDVWDLRGVGRRPGRDELEAALDRTGMEIFELRSGAATRTSEAAPTIARARAGAWISAGAFGKGAALRAAGSRLAASGLESALLDFGGQILALGGDRSGSGWAVAIAHPARRSEPVAWLRVRDRSVATTGVSERYVDVEEERVGHVLDPRTGRPVSAWGSVTVIAADPLVADILSTALFVMGPEAGIRWLETRDLPEVGAVFAVDGVGGLELRWTPAAERWRGGPRGPTPGGESAGVKSEIGYDRPEIGLTERIGTR